MIDTSLFPYETFPIRLEFGEKKDTTLCYFQCDEHLQKYLTRHKLDKRKVKVTYRDGDPTKPGKKRKNSVEQKLGTPSSGNRVRNTRDTKKLDPAGTVSRNIKSKPTTKPKVTKSKSKETEKPKRKPK